MFPDLIDLGFLHMKTYGACMAVGFLLCWTLVERLSGRKDLSNLILSLMFSGVLGSRFAYVIEHWSVEFAAHPERIIRIWEGGLMFYGGFILASVVFLGWCLANRESPLRMADLACAVVPLGHACGRIGCFFYGCCYGKDSDAWCAVTFPVGSPSWAEHGHRRVSVLPTQLFEAAALLVLFAGVLSLYALVYRRQAAGLSKRVGLVSGSYLTGYAVIRFVIEYLRGDPRAAVGPFSISQTISLGLLVVGAALVTRAFVKKPPQ